ncbi:MAG: DUF2510 domain-containing protein [Candidatus Nanopelagicales bacterium]
MSQDDRPTAVPAVPEGVREPSEAAGSAPAVGPSGQTAPVQTTVPVEATVPVQTTLPTAAAVGVMAAGAPDGWYPDPWTPGQRRYWSGESWSAHVFADRTVGDQAGFAARAGATNPFRDQHATAPDPRSAPPPHWVAPYTAPVRPAYTAPPPVEPPTESSSKPLIWIAVAVTLVAAMILGFALTRIPSSTPDAAPLPPTAPVLPTLPPVLPTPGPNSSAPVAPLQPVPTDIGRLGLRQSDVTGTIAVVPVPGGYDVAGSTTLALCNANFPSEGRRQERVQVVALGLPDLASGLLQTEVVRYDSTGGTDQAWAELQAAAASCPSTPVTSPVDGTASTTTFGPRPDTAWPVVAGVKRLAYDKTTVDDQGSSQHTVEVYLQRGNILLGVYFPALGQPQISVQGQTTIAGIVHVFEERLAALPPSGAASTGGAAPSPGTTA